MSRLKTDWHFFRACGRELCEAFFDKLSGGPLGPPLSKGGSRMPDTIAAIATAPERSAIGIIRLSGPEAVRAASAVFRPAGGCCNP